MFKELIQAIHDNNVEVVNDFVRDHHDILTETDFDKLSPLHHACMLGKTEITRILLGEGGLVPNCQTVNGTTPLHFAARNGWKDCVQLLVEFKANLNTSDQRHWSPLHYACFAGHTEVVEMLVTNKANINMMTDEGYTPLHLSCYKGYIKIAELLISHEANVSLADKQGNTPLCLLPIISTDAAGDATSLSSNEPSSPQPSHQQQQKSSERRRNGESGGYDSVERSPKKRKASERSAHHPANKRVKEEYVEDERERKSKSEESGNGSVDEDLESNPDRSECFDLIMSQSSPPDVNKKIGNTNKALSGKWGWFLNDGNRNICKDILGKLRKKKDLYPDTFESPVTEEIAPGYFSRIKRPMDFKTLDDYLDNRKIYTLKEFVICGRQIWQNCFMYNRENGLYLVAKEYALIFENLVSKAAWGSASLTKENREKVLLSWNEFLQKMSPESLWAIANKSGLGDEQELDLAKNFDPIRVGFFQVPTRDLK